MKVRRTGLATAGAAFALAALVVVIGAAQAAPPTKVYSATVHVTAPAEIDTGAGTATLTLTLKNESKNTLGSAEFKPRTGVTVVPFTDGRPTTDPDWTADHDEASGSVRLLSTTPLTKGESVSTDVEVTFGGCTDARWDTRAKQSNDFSGNPGNDFTLSSNLSLSNLRPLGNFVIDDVETVDDPTTPKVEALFVPQIIVSYEATVGVRAYDLCGVLNQEYGTHFDDELTKLEPDPALIPDRLVGADISGVDWQAGTATMTPVVVETGNVLVVEDEATGIGTASEDFDVVETICTSETEAETCTWQDKEANPGILAKAELPPPGASLGIGFNPNLEEASGTQFICNGSSADDPPVGKTFININPRDYAPNATVKIALTYKKSVTGNGAASTFDLCLSDDNGVSWDKANASPVQACSSTTPADTEAPCTIEKKRISGGDLSVILFIKAVDPWGGMS